MSVIPVLVRARRGLRLFLWIRRPEFLIFMPALTLSAFWFGGERALLLLALGMPLILAIVGQDAGRRLSSAEADPASQVERGIACMDHVLHRLDEGARTTACLIVQFDDLGRLLERHGRATQTEVQARAMDRIRGTLRLGDRVAPLQGGSIMIVLSPLRRMDLDTLVQLATRLQEGVAAPYSLGGAQIYVTCSVGFCQAERAPERDGRAMLDAAQAAADEAARHGPSAIRAFSEDMAERRATRAALRDSLEDALDRGEIRPHFQPQISTDTGAVSGLEALARWHHPLRGLLSPAEFLHAVECSDLTDRLGEVMLHGALSALVVWDRSGIEVPAVSVNFSASELRNPRLPERIRWELDRFSLKPPRLTVEILETVVAQAENDVLVANIARLAQMGCGIDLDDFGTGHASIASLRRFAVRRLKIDRSFVTHADQDREQQRVVSAIVSLAERLGLETVAEGVETQGEQSILSQLGCSHLQGFGLARPMPVEEATAWLLRHQTRPGRVVPISMR